MAKPITKQESEVAVLRVMNRKYKEALLKISDFKDEDGKPDYCAVIALKVLGKI